MKATGYWKIGAFVVAGAALAVVAVLYLSSGLLGRSTVDYQVYFDESVEGLDVGSLVRFRGVTLGQVSRIHVGPDERHIQVTCALRTGDLRSQGLELVRDHEAYLKQLPGLRAQLSVIGLTGQEIVLLDYFDPKAHPVPVLPFPTPPRTIPATPGTLGRIESSLEVASARLPELVDSLAQLVEEVRQVLAPLHGNDLAGQARTTIARADRVLANLERITGQLSAERAPENLGRALAELDATLSSLRGLVEGLGGEHGVIDQTQRAADALVQTTQASNPLGREIEDTLRDAQSTLAALRRLADTLEREPDALIKGRAGNQP